jgi:hypothetical protein
MTSLTDIESHLGNQNTAQEPDAFNILVYLIYPRSACNTPSQSRCPDPVYRYAPPSMPMVLPVIHPAASEARKHTTGAMSSGRPARESGEIHAVRFGTPHVSRVRVVVGKRG